MEQKLLRKVQLTELKIAKELKRVCEKLDIPYILDSGTLLGAVRHRGFIPWDDDMDFAMTRANYDRFLLEAPAELGEEYYLQSWKSDPAYGYPFAKLRLKNTAFVEAVSQYAGSEKGFYVDIFPYDVYPNGQAERKRQGRAYDLLRRLIMLKGDYTPWEAGNHRSLKKIIYKTMAIAALPFSREQLIHRFETATRSFNDSSSGKVFSCGTDNYGTWVVDESCFTQRCQLPFEDDSFSAPENWDSYLSDIYGDYMTPPPEEERENKHQPVLVDFGEYAD